MPEEIPEILNSIDTRFNIYRQVIKQTQEAYFAQNKRYWQGLWTHSVTPSMGEVAPDRLGDSPTDQLVSWEDMLSQNPEISFPNTMLSRIKIDVFHDGSGHGYVVILERDVDGDMWQKQLKIRGSEETESEWNKLVKGL